MNPKILKKVYVTKCKCMILTTVNVEFYLLISDCFPIIYTTASNVFIYTPILSTAADCM